MTAETPPIALTIAGSDPSGGAGIQADLKTFAALGIYGASVIAALTAQNTVGVSGVFAIPPDFIAAQFRAVVSDLSIAAIKTGMLGDLATVEMVASLLDEVAPVPVVVDPVMVATSGDVLLRPEAIDAVRSALIPRAALITPNIPEASRLLDSPEAKTDSEMRAQAEALMQLGCRAVLVKGGHGDGDDVLDILFDGKKHFAFRRPRIATSNTHGTGCTLSAAIAAGLANGKPMDVAVADAKGFVWDALSAGADMQIGKGRNGPLDHNFALRKS
jgi:hydroxymethylpyrimidine/phosphomethylpyrimidine kinase